MESFTLGSDVYLEFTAKVNKRPARILNVMGELYRNGEYIKEFSAISNGSTVSGTINGVTFSSIGEYMAKFSVFLDSMGKREHAIPFKITKSVLGKKRL